MSAVAIISKTVQAQVAGCGKQPCPGVRIVCKDRGVQEIRDHGILEDLLRILPVLHVGVGKRKDTVRKFAHEHFGIPVELSAGGGAAIRYGS